jgi:magnesium transporter
MLTEQQKALNLFNAALVTPTYYVYFTTSTIVASAVLFQGFHGTVTQIVDVVLGFLVICSGVVLLQLAKSSKDVPDTAVFSGDLDQVRTVAEQEEPEYEPRADTIRGGAGIVRAMSKVRTKRQMEEAKRIHEEHMEPIGENEEVEWDGLRRRKTVSSGGRSATGSLSRRKTVHPPLGMSHFPDDVSEPDSEVHPGFFGRIARKPVPSRSQKSRNRRTGTSPVPLSSVLPVKMGMDDREEEAQQAPHVYGLPPELKIHEEHAEEDTSYRGAGAGAGAGASSGPHIHFAGDAGEGRERAESRGSSLAPPRPPPHVQTPTSSGSGSGKRTFSFQEIFHRKRDTDSAHAQSAVDNRPISRAALSYTSQSSREYPTGGATTEEERLGLVSGDGSRSTLPRYSEVPDEDPERRSSEEWQVTSGTSSSPEVLGAGGDLGRQRTRDPYDEFDEEELYDEPLRSPLTRDEEDRGRGGRGAFV